MPKPRGKLIVLDGTDGSGKATQTDLLFKRLKKEKISVEKISFPQYNTKSAGLIEEYLNGKYGSADEVGPKIASIFYACDRYDASFKIRKWLNEGKIVLCDRYLTANMGHQGSKIKKESERKKYYSWLDDLEFNLFKIPRPDLNIILYANPSLAQKLSLKRKKIDWQGKTKDIHQENLEHLKKSAKVYLEIANFNKSALINCSPDGIMLAREQIHEIIWQKIKKIPRK